VTARRDVIVVAAGLLTTALAFAVVWLAGRSGENLLGEYGMALGFIPVPGGAFALGLLASLGYGAGSYFTQRKVTGRLLIAVMALLAGGYFAAQWIEYRQVTAGLGAGAIGFWSWFDRVTRSFAWKEQFGDGLGQPLGDLGYALRALEIAGFVGGGLIVPAALRKRPYCDRCLCYRQTKLAAIVPAADDEPDAHRRMQAILRAARTGSFDEIAQAIVTHGPLSGRHAAEGSQRWLSASLLYCPSCADGTLIAKSHQRSDEQRRQISVVPTEIVPLGAGLVRELLAGGRQPGHPYR
jgi:hypothetical protein